MGRETLSLSFPAEMVREIDETRKREHRTRSEIMREAWRQYVAARNALPVYNPTKSELAAIRKGREEVRRGNVATVEEFFADVDRRAQSGSGKGRRPRTKKGAGSTAARG